MRGFPFSYNIDIELEALARIDLRFVSRVQSIPMLSVQFLLLWGHFSLSIQIEFIDSLKL